MKKSSPRASTSRRRRRSAAVAVLAYFDERRDALLSARSSARRYFAVEGLHDLRVEIKRLRALYRLVKAVEPSFDARSHAGRLRPLFRAAGALRDIDIYQAISLRALKDLDLREYFNHLKQEELRERSSFAANAGSFSRSALSESRAGIRKALAALPDEKIRRKTCRKIVKVAAGLESGMSRKKASVRDLHAIRKQAKFLRYLLDVHREVSGPTRATDEVSARLKKQFGLLGEWHDFVMTLQSLKALIGDRSSRDVEDPAAYRTFRAQLRERAGKLLVSYDRGRRPLLTALDRMVRHFRVQLSES